MKNNLKEKLESLEKKVLVGGENLLEKAEAQQELLETSAKELELRQAEELKLKQAIEEKEVRFDFFFSFENNVDFFQAERVDIEEKYSSLQEEASGKTKKLKKVAQMVAAAKSELNDLNQEHQREKDGLWEVVRALNKEIQLHQIIINSYIPMEYQVSPKLIFF